ncbi:hypothetical protein BV20DRAFT_991001 [Pilatotrama ljubarskyi]|nr:hypothetical protein BV20DRAFT_991001 [Pilatotrama ljubarskyi]
MTMGSLSYHTSPCGTFSTAVLSPDNVIELAKEVVHSTPLICDWARCHAELNSWRTLQEHLHRHCSQLEPSSSQQGTLECMIPKCSGRFHTSLPDMHQHIDLSHLSRVLLPCPVQDCPLTFGRNAHGLPEHLQSSHRDLLDGRIPSGSPSIRPLRHPFPHFPEDLPPLPERDIPAFTFSAPVIHPRRPPRSQTPASSQGGRQRRWKRMATAQPAPADEEESSLPLADLPPFDPKQLPDIPVWRKPPEVALQQSRPQHMIVPPIPEREPPVSIGYDAFAEKFVELEKAGVIDGSGNWPRPKEEMHPQKPKLVAGPERVKSNAALAAPL